MASVVASSAVVAPAAFSAASSSGSASEASSMRAFVGLKSGDVFSSKTADLSSRTVSNGSRVNCMQVWTPVDNKKFETLSYLPALSSNQIAKQIDFMLSKGWIPCLEFDKSAELKVVRGQPGFYNGRYWTMWKLPMFGCNDASSVLREVENCRKAYPNCYIRVLGFDNQRQVQCSAFIVHKPVKNALTEKLDRSLAKPAYKPQPQVSSVVTSRSGWSRDVEVYQPKDDKTVVDKINSLQAGLDGLQRELALLRASAAHDKIKILQGALDGLQREISVLRASVGHTV